MSRGREGGFAAGGGTLLRCYSAAMALGVAALLVPLRWGRRIAGLDGPEVLQQLLAHPRGFPEAAGADVLIHAVSAGEMRAAGAVIRQLLSLRPSSRLVVTTGSATGMATGRALQRDLPGICAVSMLPWDRARAMRRWLAYLSPKALVVVETELWPNLFDACRRLGIPLAVINARIYPADLKRYTLIRFFMRRVLDCADWIGLQDETERQRFLAIGADPDRLVVLGNSKSFPPDSVGPASRSFAGSAARRIPTIVAGSTHPPEESVLLEVLRGLRRRFPTLRLVLAPRHCQRGAALAATAARRGWRPCQFSLGRWRDGPWDVLILDRMGELLPFYAAADAVFVGGSLADRGGHNFLEPAHFGRPIVVGPHLENFRAAADRFLAQGALWEVRDPAGLEAALVELLRDPALAQGLGDRARACAEAERRRAGDYGRAVAQMLADFGQLPGQPGPREVEGQPGSLSGCRETRVPASGEA